MKLFMLSPLIRAKCKAAMIHGCISAIIAFFTGYFVFSVWYPDQLASMLGGVELYQLLLVVELGLGPVISLIIYNPKKCRSEIIKDYTVIAVIQLSALFYGLYAVAQSRPVFIVFVKDRFEVITPVELEKKDLLLADKKYQNLSWFGPEYICIESPTDPQEQSQLLFSALDGKDIQLYPKYYRDCLSNEVLNKSYDEKSLFAVFAQRSIDNAQLENISKEGFTWLPAKSRFGVWVKLFPKDKSINSQYINVDPFSRI